MDACPTFVLKRRSFLFGIDKKSSCVLREVFFTLLEKCTFFRIIRNIIGTIDGQEIPEEEKIHTLKGRYYIQTIDDIFFFTKIED